MPVVPGGPEPQSDTFSIEQLKPEYRSLVIDQLKKQGMDENALRNVDPSRIPNQYLIPKPSAPAVRPQEGPEPGFLGSLWKGIQEGYVSHDVMHEGAKYLRNRDPATKARLTELQAQLEQYNDPRITGFRSWFKIAGSILGQQVAQFSEPEAVLAAGAGGVAGSFAPGIGTGLGMAFGLAAHMANDSFQVGSGDTYISSLEAGIDPDTAVPLALGAGVLNGALEMVGVAGVAAPLTDAAKFAWKKAIGEVVKSPPLVAAATKFAKQWGTAVAIETVTEMAQELVNVTAEEIGKLIDRNPNIDPATNQEILDRLVEVGVETFKGMALLAAPGPGLNMVTQLRAGKKNKKDVTALDALKERMSKQMDLEDEAKLEAAAGDVSDMLKQAGANHVFIDGEALQSWLGEDPAGQDMAQAMGISKELDEAELMGTHVAVPAEAFARYILASDRYEALKDHIKLDESGITATEARDYAESGIEEDIEELNNTPEPQIGEDVPSEGPMAFEAFHVTREDGPVATTGKFVTLDQTGDLLRYDGNGGVFGPEGVYIDPTGMWSSGELLFGTKLDVVKKVEATVDKPLIITPDTIKQIGVDATEAGYATGSFVKGPDLVRYAKERGHDAIVIQGFPDLDEDTVINRSDYPELDAIIAADDEALKADWIEREGAVPQSFYDEGVIDSPTIVPHSFWELTARAAGIDPDITQDQIFVFDPEALKVVGDASIEEAEAFYKSGKNMFDQRKPVRSSVPSSPTLDAEEQALGLAGFYQSADEAGMTQKEYSAYLAKLEHTRTEARKRAEDAALKREQEQNTAEIREAKAQLEQRARESLSNHPVYAAIDSIANDRMDVDQVNEILSKYDLSAENLPKQARGRKIAVKGGTLDLDILADLYGFDDAETMLVQMANSKPIEVVAREQAEQAIRQEFSHLFDNAARIREAREALHNTSSMDLIVDELNHLRGLKKEKRIKASTLRTAAKKRLLSTPLHMISGRKFLQAEKKYAKLARRALRKGDREAAKVFKFKQALNHAMALETFRVQGVLANQYKWLKKFDTSNDKRFSRHIPVHTLQSVRGILSKISFRRTLMTGEERDALAAIKESMKDFVETPVVLQQDGKLNYQRLSLQQWNEIYNTVREVYKQGLDEKKFSRRAEKNQLDSVVSHISENIEDNLKLIQTQTIDRSRWRKTKEFGRRFLSQVVFMDTLVAKIDGDKPDGWAYRYLKEPYDMAMSGGYREGQVGFLERKAKEFEAIRKVYDIFTKKELLNIHKPIRIPGVGRKVSRNEALSVLLNLGNATNKEALLAGNQFSERELDAIVEWASEKDWKFVQSIWDHVSTFWPEIEEALIRRMSLKPEKVEATPIETKYGTMKGGYYPIRYDVGQSGGFGDREMADIVNAVKYGRTIRAYTRPGHTLTRTTNAANNPVLLDLSVYSAHIHSVVYDLEMGDAIRDIMKVLYNKDLVRKFRQHGQAHLHDAMDAWLQDIIVGDRGPSNIFERGVKALRTGTVISELGWNFGVGFLQPLGLLQSAASIGYGHILYGMGYILSHPVQTWNFINSQSNYMKARSDAWSRDILEAETALSKGFLDRYTPGNSAAYIRDSLFFIIKKFQRLVDAATWIGAKRKGMQLFNGDEVKAIRYADRKVANTQGSGISGDRSAFERGTVGNVKQSEWIKALTPFISYFIAKWNVTATRTRETNFKSPAQVTRWAIDMAVLFVVETYLAALLRGQLPDDDDDKSFVAWLAEETAYTALGMVPVARELAGEFRGLPSGRFLGMSNFVNAARQVSQWEWDRELFKSVNSVLGMLKKYPSRQINKTLGTYLKMTDGDEVAFSEWLYGPKR